ncbi:MAG: hypothetical protein AB4041_11875 [Microcystaceae cyanobacterium]
MATRNSHSSRRKNYFKRISLKKLWQNSLKFIRNHQRFSGLLAITLILIFFIVTVSLLPSEQPFEGRLELTNLSFTSQKDQGFLNYINDISSIQYRSTPTSQPLTLSGQFNDPKLQTLNEIKLNPNPSASQLSWTLTSQGILAIKEMELTQDSKINNLTYDSYNKRLSLDINPNKNKPLTLIINASDSLTLTFSGYTISKLPNAKSITWQPNAQLIIPIKDSIKLNLNFPQTPTSSLFRRQLAVRNVSFNQLIDNYQDYRKNYPISTIVGGIIRLANQNHTLADGQFLTFDSPDSIRRLFNLKLTSQTSSTLTTNDNQTLSLNPSFEGLNVDISGVAKQIKVGINRNLPIATFQASWLETWFSRDAVIGLIAFLSSLVATLMSWMWELLTEEEEEEAN